MCCFQSEEDFLEESDFDDISIHSASVLSDTSGAATKKKARRGRKKRKSMFAVYTRHPLRCVFFSLPKSQRNPTEPDCLIMGYEEIKMYFSLSFICFGRFFSDGRCSFSRQLFPLILVQSHANEEPAYCVVVLNLTRSVNLSSGSFVTVGPMFCVLLRLLQRKMATVTRRTTRTTVRFASRAERSSCVTPVPERTTWCVWTLSWRRPPRANGAVHTV